MSKPDLVVPAAEANRRFSKLLRAARDGQRITITSHGEPVAELIPAGAEARETAERELRAKAHRELVDQLRSAKRTVVGPWTRDELYERD